MSFLNYAFNHHFTDLGSYVLVESNSANSGRLVLLCLSMSLAGQKVRLWIMCYVLYVENRNIEER